MGFTLSCFFLKSFSTFIYWVVDREISNTGSLNYLDNFLFIGKADSSDCLMALNKFIDIANFFGIPLASEKIVFPCTCLQFWGINIDNLNMEFYLPESKITRTKILLLKLLAAKETTIRELESLLGLLVFTSRVITMGRVFSKRLYWTTSGVKSLFAHIRWTKQIKEDLKIWLQFISNFNGHSIRQDKFILTQSLTLYTDAAGSIGYGAFYNGHWSAVRWADIWIQKRFTKNTVLLKLFFFSSSLYLGQKFQEQTSFITFR